jgi:hypothetical protein
VEEFRCALPIDENKRDASAACESAGVLIFV